MSGAAAKLNGTWLQESLEGDIDAYFKFEGVGWIMRNAVWMAGYGNGKTMFDQLIHDGKYYNVRHTDENTKFRGVASLNGKKEPTLFSETFPLIEIRAMEMEGTETPEGTLEFTFFRLDGTEHSKAKKSIVDEEGQIMHTALSWTDEAGTACSMTVICRKQPEARLSVEQIPSFITCTMTDAIESGVEGKKKAISESLEGRFESAQAMLKLGEETERNPPGLGAEAKVEDTGPGAFTVSITTPEGVVNTFEHKYDHEKLTYEAKATVNGKSWGVWNFQALNDPVRMSCWNTMDNEMWSTKSSIDETQNIVDKLLKAQKKD